VREDLILTTRLTREFFELNSLSHRASRCPGSGSRKTRFDKRPNGGFPCFKCGNCWIKFTRRLGSPFVDTKMSPLERMRTLIQHLSLPLSYMDVSDVAGTSDDPID
jgi:transposase-like protein